MRIQFSMPAKPRTFWMRDHGRAPWKPEASSFSGAWLLLLQFFILMGAVHGQAIGIAIVKETATHPDASAKVFEYQSLRSMGQVNVYMTPEGKEIRLNLFQPQSRVAYPDFMSRPITSPDQLGLIRNGIQSYRDTIARYPRTEPYLTRHVEAAEEIIRRVNGGEILFNGRWMSAGEHKALVIKEEAMAKEFNERSNAKKLEKEALARRREMEALRRKR